MSRSLDFSGGISGAGIFPAQYFGQKDHEGVRQTFRYKFWLALILTGEGAAEELDATCMYGKQYLAVMLVGLPAFMMSQIYTGTLRECGETVALLFPGLYNTNAQAKSLACRLRFC